MVCMAGHFKMASVLKLMMENHATPDEVINEKSASHILQKQLLSAHEPNLLDEDERCTSGKVNPNDLMGVEDDVHPMKPPKKGRKIKLTSNGNQKVHIKVKLKSQPENRNIVNDFELTNGNESKPSNSIADQRLKTSVDNSSAINAPERHFRDVPAPLATKMYHPRGNYRLRLELAQLYRDSCVEQSHGYASNTTPTSSQNNGLVPCDNSTLHGCHDSALHGSDNSVLHGARKSSIPPKKLLDQLLASTSGLCSGISPQLSSSGPSRLQATKFQKADTPVSAVRNELGRSRCNKAAVPSSKTTGKKKTQKQSNALPAI
ncbi:uncharacterized protein LOC123452791 isoform X5 [Hordeum vulgare subsp. vulgare]|uniref:uncharacterized protein LOC123452791 isoform X5 n=1 Tax=Hordeum vulgare subsp. vulgare TaxID=112509 RepID=UPI001D1A3D45|nr:uncharacterized protein LOC123452791 isoform X5 [Hordeum vulgare subsp. vulgare]